MLYFEKRISDLETLNVELKNQVKSISSNMENKLSQIENSIANSNEKLSHMENIISVSNQSTNKNIDQLAQQISFLIANFTEANPAPNNTNSAEQIFPYNSQPNANHFSRSRSCMNSPASERSSDCLTVSNASSFASNFAKLDDPTTSTSEEKENLKKSLCSIHKQ